MSMGKGRRPSLPIEYHLKNKKRTRQIRVTDETYAVLASMGDMTNDFEDVIAFLLKFYRERQRHLQQEKSK